MTRLLARLLWLPVLVALAGCSFPIRNESIDNRDIDRPKYVFRDLQIVELEDTLVIVTASGGGTRAAALAMAVLQTMGDVRLPSGRSLADKVDIISSVSGGSVTAAYFALHGARELPRLESDFVRKDGMTPLILRGIAGLPMLASPGIERIDLLIDYFDRQLFNNATFTDLITRKRRPYLILNAADMVEGTPFPFTQYTMDLLCSDLAKMKISTAVAASAAFPVALSPVTLKNYRTPAAAGERSCLVDGETRWVRSAMNTDWHLNPTRAAAARTANAYLAGRKKYIHLLDGGISDNLGVAEPYRLLTSNDVDPLFREAIAKGEIRKIVFIMVNARSAPHSDLDAKPDTPGMIDMLSASIGASIDRATFGTSERIRTLLKNQLRAYSAEAASRGHVADAANYKTAADNAHFVAVDFDAIKDEDCRQRFHNIGTNWSLSKQEIDALKAMGEALLVRNRYFDDVRTLLKATDTRSFTTVEAACALLPKKDS